jgi:hypothetical protein
MNPPFLNREAEIKQLLGEPEERALWYVYGEAGIGKSALLAALKGRIHSGAPPDGTGSLVILVDMAELGDVDAERRPALLLEAIRIQVEQSEETQVDDTSAAGLAAHIIDRSYQTPVYLLFDTTEAIQQDMEFWNWFENSLISPLAVEGTLHQVFAGRIPVPWGRYEIRRVAKPMRLEPLTQDTVVRRLIEDAVLTHMPQAQESPLLPQVVEVISDLGCGHPELIVQLACDVTKYWPLDRQDAGVELHRTLCQATVKPFIQSNLFEGIDDRWQLILWWASILKWFDLTILPAYLQEVMPELEENGYFFLQGINRLRQGHIVVWQEKVGDRLHGVIPHIVAKCMRTLEPENFRKANAAALDVLQEIHAELLPGSPEAQQFEEAMAIHRQLAKGEEDHGHH